MNNKQTATDLHIRYTMETGNYFQWNSSPRYSHEGTGFHSTESYNREYCKWIEEQYLELQKAYIKLQK